jgi:RNA polymerase sigma-70 factor (ECF subfamily)
VSAEPAAQPRDFESFFAAAYSRILAQAIMLCGNREDAEDATQEGFVESYRAWDRLAHYDLPEAWVYRVVVQRLWKVYRKRKTGQERVLQLPAPEQAGPEQTAEAREVLRLLAGLPPRQRITMVLFCLHGWSQQEVAAALRMTRGGVAANVSKARQTLREALGMAADGTVGREPLMARPAGGWLGRTVAGGDPLLRLLRDTESWLRAAVVADPGAVGRARAALAHRLGEGG